MRTTHHHPLLAALLVLLGLTGCRSHTAEFSGFLDGYDQLEPAPDDKNAYRYRNPDKDLADYDRFIVEPVMLHFAPNAKGTSIDPKRAGEVVDHFQAKLAEELSENYLVVDQPGAGTARVRMAITSIEKTTPALNIHPGTKLSGAGLGGASIEGELVDTADGVRIFAFVDSDPGNRFTIAEGLDAVGHAKWVIDKWVEEVVGRLDRAHGRE